MFWIKHEYTIEYSYGGVKMLAFVEAISKKQAEDIFKERYSDLCRIVSIKTIAEKSDELTDCLIELTKKNV